MRLAVLALIASAAPARAELAPVRAQLAPMTAASDGVCELLRADRHDGCKRLAHADSPLGAAAVYQAGSPDLRRIVLAIDTGDGVLIAPGIDLYAGDATLERAQPTVRPVQIDGRPGLVLDLVTTFHKRGGERWHTEAIVGCGHTPAGAWTCASIDVGTCDATIDADGGVATSCGGHARLSLAR
jgi:hypothetical protein